MKLHNKLRDTLSLHVLFCWSLNLRKQNLIMVGGGRWQRRRLADLGIKKIT